MADEIDISLELNVLKTDFEFNFSDTFQDDLTGDGGGNPGQVTIGTSEEDISFGDLTTAGWVVMKNIDPTNFVQWGPKSAGVMVPLGKLYPGKVAMFYIDSVSVVLRMIADTAACKVIINVLEV